MREITAGWCLRLWRNTIHRVDGRLEPGSSWSPTAWTAITLPTIYGDVYQTTQADRWVYRRSYGQFPAVLTIGVDGRVQEIDFERARTDASVARRRCRSVR